MQFSQSLGHAVSVPLAAARHRGIRVLGRAAPGPAATDSAHAECEGVFA
jgi:hypothetical protein